MDEQDRQEQKQHFQELRDDWITVQTETFRLWDCTFDQYEVTPENASAIELAKGYATMYLHSDDNPYHAFLTIIGEPGRGKTRLAKTILLRLIEQFPPERFAWGQEPTIEVWQVPMLLAQIRKGFSDHQHKTPFDDCVTASLLVLDDVGMQHDTPWAVEQLDCIIDSRYEAGRTTIFTTNMTISKLPSRIASRLNEGEVIILKGPDHRQVLAKARIEARNKVKVA